MQWQQLLERLPDDLPLESLKIILCSTIASNKDQQDKFYGLFDQSLERVKALNFEAVTTRLDQKSNSRFLSLSIIILAALVTLIVFFWPHNKIDDTLTPPILRLSFSVGPNDTKSYCLDEITSIIGSPKTIANCQNTLSDTISTLYGTYKLVQPNCIEYIAASVIGVDTLCFILTNIDETSTYNIEVIAIVEENLTFSENELSKPVFDTIPSLKSISLNTLIKELNWYEKFFLDNEFWIRSFSILLIGLLFWLILWYWEKKKAQIDCRGRKQQ